MLIFFDLRHAQENAKTDSKSVDFLKLYYYNKYVLKIKFLNAANIIIAFDGGYLSFYRAAEVNCPTIGLHIAFYLAKRAI